MERGESFTLELGAPLRFRLLDAEPKQAAQDFSGHLRRQDWDTHERLRPGPPRPAHWPGGGDGGPLLRWPLNTFQLGEGHLVDRYDNQLSPDYHPAGAVLTVNVGPTRVQVAASDILAQRLFAGEVRLDIGQLASAKPENAERYYAIASVAHDFGKIGEESTESITAALLGGDRGALQGRKPPALRARRRGLARGRGLSGHRRLRVASPSATVSRARCASAAGWRGAIKEAASASASSGPRMSWPATPPRASTSRHSPRSAWTRTSRASPS